MLKKMIVLLTIFLSSQALNAWGFKNENLYFDDKNNGVRDGALNIKNYGKPFHDKEILESTWLNKYELSSTLVGVKHCIREFSFGKPIDYNNYVNKSKEYYDTQGQMKGLTLVEEARMRELYSSRFRVNYEWSFSFWWWSYSYVDGCFWSLKHVNKDIADTVLNKLDSYGSQFDFQALKLTVKHDNINRDANLYISNTNNNLPEIKFSNAEVSASNLEISFDLEAGGKEKWHADKFFASDKAKIRVKIKDKDLVVSIVRKTENNEKKFDFVGTNDGYYTTPTDFGSDDISTNSFSNIINIKTNDGTNIENILEDLVFEYSDDDGETYYKADLSSIDIEVNDEELELANYHIYPSVSEGKNVNIGYLEFSNNPTLDTNNFTTTGFNQPFDNMKIVKDESKYMLVVEELINANSEDAKKEYTQNGQIKFDGYESIDLSFNILVNQNKDFDGDFIPNHIEKLIGTLEDDPDQDKDETLDGMNTTSTSPFSDPLGTKANQWYRFNNENYTANLYTKEVYGRTLGLNRINEGSADILVVDTGIHSSHEDLNIDAVNSYNSYGNDGEGAYGDPTPPEGKLGHGTNVAGVISAKGFNGVGLKGVAPMASVAGYTLKSEGRIVTTNVDDLENAWLKVGAGISYIVNNSFGSCISTAHDNRNIIDKVNDEFLLNRSFVFAAGNERQIGCNDYTTDANLNFSLNSRYSISVASIDSNAKYSSFSSPGANLMISAPGERIATTNLDDGYVFTNGTSFAAPFVSGVVALVRQECSFLDARTINYLIASTAVKIDDENSTWVKNSADIWHSRDYGHGLINAQGIIEECLKNSNNLPEEKKEESHIASINWANGGMFVGASNGESKIFEIDIDTNYTIESVSLTILFGGHQGFLGKYNSDKFANLEISLESPEGTVHKVLASNNALLSIDDESEESVHFTQGSLKFLARGFLNENSEGTWKVILKDNANVEDEEDLKFQILGLEIFGHEKEEN